MKVYFISTLYFFIFCQKFINGASVPSQTGGKCDSVCTTPICEKEAEFFKKYMDPTVDPCNDFYQFVCGNYVKNVPIPHEKGGITHFHTIWDKISGQLISQLNDTIKSSDLNAFKNVKTHYQDCLNEDVIEKIGTAPIMQLLEELGGWPVLLGDSWKCDNYKWEDSVSNISKQGFIPDFPIKLSISYDPTNTSNYVLQVKPAVTTIDETFFMPGSRSLEAYETLLTEIAVLLGATREKATVEMKECSQFEVELSKLRSAALNALSPLENRQTVKVLSGRYPDMPWLDILEKILKPSNVNINEEELLQVEDPQYVSKIGELIKKTPKRVLANYQIWRVIYRSIDYLPRSFRNYKFYLDKVTFGLQKQARRDEFCFNLLQTTFQTAIGSIYVKNYFDEKSKIRANEILQNMRIALEPMLHALQWMDEKTRDNALLKLRTMKSGIGYADEIVNDTKIENYYADLEIIPGNFFDGYRKVTNHCKNVELTTLRTSMNVTKWIFETDVAAVNAFYYSGHNKIRIAAGILQEPLFKFGRPDYLNYGGIGYIMGHEVTHGYDSEGRRYDKNGNYNDWWDKNTAIELEKRANCIVNQYNDYVVTQINQKMDGNRTKAENIADVGGIKLAYHAYQNHVDSIGTNEQCLPKLNYSPQQMFWINAGSILCTKVTDQIMRFLLVDAHSPPEARVNVAFSNIPEFSNDFTCALGSKMNPRDKCSIW